MDKVKQFLIEKLGAEGVKEIESAIAEIMKEKDEKIVSLTENLRKSDNERGFLKRKLRAIEKANEVNLQKKLQEQREFIINKAEEFYNNKIKSLSQQNRVLRQEVEERKRVITEKAGKFIDDVIGEAKAVAVKECLREAQKNFVYRLFKKAVDFYNNKKISDVPNIKHLNEQLNEQRNKINILKEENEQLKRKVFLLRETRMLKDDDLELVKEAVRGIRDPKVLARKVEEIKHKILESKRKPIITRTSTREEDREVIEEASKQISTSSIGIDANLESKIIEMVEL